MVLGCVELDLPPLLWAQLTCEPCALCRDHGSIYCFAHRTASYIFARLWSFGSGLNANGLLDVVCARARRRLVRGEKPSSLPRWLAVAWELCWYRLFPHRNDFLF